MRRVVLLAALLCLGACSSGSPDSATLVLSDPFWQRVNVEAVLTTGTDCDSRDKGYIATRTFTMTKATTHKIEAPNGADICWRHDRNPDSPKKGEWSGWSRATLFPGQTSATDL